MQSNADARGTVTQAAESRGTSDHAGYGLPCANCRKYYAADLSACPTCQSTQRVGLKPSCKEPQAASTTDATRVSETAPQAARALEDSARDPHVCCNQKRNPRGHTGAAVCKTCYEQANDRMNTMEAALHMDLKEATQIIYEAVWADSSDPNKSYQNAAQALLTEIRKRAGVIVLLGPIQSLPH
jgi:hypothetical protein